MSESNNSVINDSYNEKTNDFYKKDAYIAIKLCRKLLYSICQSPLFPNIIVPKLKNQR